MDIIQAIPLSPGKYKLVDIDIVQLLDIFPVGFKNPDQFKDLVFLFIICTFVNKKNHSPNSLKQPKKCFYTMLFFTFMLGEGGGQ